MNTEENPEEREQVIDLELFSLIWSGKNRSGFPLCLTLLFILLVVTFLVEADKTVGALGLVESDKCKEELRHRYLQEERVVLRHGNQQIVLDSFRSHFFPDKGLRKHSGKLFVFIELLLVHE